MIVIPAVDIRGGKCVRLVQGKADQETVYDDNPLEVAVAWEKRGAKKLHVIDLDGAFEGTPQNSSLVESILLNVRIPTQVGGGVRSPATVDRYLSAGAARVILGTVAFHNVGLIAEIAEAHPGQIVIGIDAKNGQVAVDGWVRQTGFPAIELVKEYAKIPIAAFVYTDVSRDGMLVGPNIDAIHRFVEATSHTVIASGGVGSLDDIRNLAAANLPNLEGVIVGKALYSGNLSIEAANEAAGG